MIDKATIKKLGDEYDRVMIEVESLLGDELENKELCSLSALISRHLIRVELGRAPTRTEYAVVIEHMEETLHILRGR